MRLYWVVLDGFMSKQELTDDDVKSLKNQGAIIEEV